MFLNAKPWCSSGSGELPDPLLLHFDIQTPLYRPKQCCRHREPAALSPTPSTLIISTIRACNSLPKEGSCPRSSGGKPKKHPWKCPQPLSCLLQKCGVAPALQDCTAPLAMVHSWGSTCPLQEMEKNGHFCGQGRSLDFKHLAFKNLCSTPAPFSAKQKHSS